MVLSVGPFYFAKQYSNGPWSLEHAPYPAVEAVCFRVTFCLALEPGEVLAKSCNFAPPSCALYNGAKFAVRLFFALWLSVWSTFLCLRDHYLYCSNRRSYRWRDIFTAISATNPRAKWISMGIPLPLYERTWMENIDRRVTKLICMELMMSFCIKGLSSWKDKGDESITASVIRSRNCLQMTWSTKCREMFRDVGPAQLLRGDPFIKDTLSGVSDVL